MTIEVIEAFYKQCIVHGLTTEETVEQLVILGVTSKEYSEWLNKYHS